MTYLFWGLLNIALLLFFITICFKATKLIRENIGFFASIIFVFGLLSFVSHTNSNNKNTEPNSNQIKTWKFISEDSIKNSDTYLLNIDLEKTLVTKYDLGIKYYKNNQSQMNIPISAYSSTTGFISGINWLPVSININKTNDNNKFQYNVIGEIEWKLLGTTIYSQNKMFSGTAMIK